MLECLLLESISGIVLPNALVFGTLLLEMIFQKKDHTSVQNVLEC